MVAGLLDEVDGGFGEADARRICGVVPAVAGGSVRGVIQADEEGMECEVEVGEGVIVGGQRGWGGGRSDVGVEPGRGLRVGFIYRKAGEAAPEAFGRTLVEKDGAVGA